MNAVDAGIQILNLVIAGTLTFERAMQLREQLSLMQEQGRDPSSEEWAALFKENDELSAQLDELAKRPDAP